MKVELEIYGLSYWAWGDERLEGGLQHVETDDPDYLRAIADAADAGVGVRLLKPSRRALRTWIAQRSK